MAAVYRITLPSDDISRSVSFYRQLLGSDGRRVSPGRHYFDCGDVIVSCYDATANGDNREFRANPDYVYFAVDNIEATHAKAKEAGAPLDLTPTASFGTLGAVELRPWGERSFYTHDPSGNPLCFTAAETVFRQGTLPG